MPSGGVAAASRRVRVLFLSSSSRRLSENEKSGVGLRQLSQQAPLTNTAGKKGERPYSQMVEAEGDGGGDERPSTASLAAGVEKALEAEARGSGEP